MDTFFLSHGSPLLSIDETIPAQSFFKSWLPAAVVVPELRRSILVVSAHWETDAPDIRTHRNGTYHYNPGKVLAPLRGEGVLVLGSGSATHNLGKMGRDDELVLQWASDFDTWLRDPLLVGR
ncbi:hypothetical protein VPH35_054536 [Triticum aestivum]